MPNALTPEKLRDLARAGAEAALKQLRAEIIAIEQTFPELALPKRRKAIQKSFSGATRRARTMAPEQIQQHHLDERCDLFALGAVLYECLTGRRAFSGSSVMEVLGQVLHVDPPPASQLRASLIEAHDSLPAAARKDPRDRFQSSAVSCDR
jgi:serine/threonine protein kinase